MHSLLRATVLVWAVAGLVVRLDEKDRRFCFVLRGGAVPETLKLSYVVYAPLPAGTRVELRVTERATGAVQAHVKDFKVTGRAELHTTGADPLDACFISPDKMSKSIKVHVEHWKRAQTATKSELTPAQELADKLSDETMNLEDRIYTLYMHAQDSSEVFQASERFLRRVSLLKTAVFGLVGLGQSWLLVRVAMRGRSKLSELI